MNSRPFTLLLSRGTVWITPRLVWIPSFTDTWSAKEEPTVSSVWAGPGWEGMMRSCFIQSFHIWSLHVFKFNITKNKKLVILNWKILRLVFLPWTSVVAVHAKSIYIQHEGGLRRLRSLCHAVITGLYLREDLTKHNMVAPEPHSAARRYCLTLRSGISIASLSS